MNLATEVFWCQRNSMANYLPVQSITLCIDWFGLELYSKHCRSKAVEVSHWWPEVSWCQEVLWQIIFQCNQSRYVLIDLYCVTAYWNTVGQFFIPKTVVLKLWKFLIDDLKSLGAKKFYGKFSSGAINHVNIRTLQVHYSYRQVIYRVADWSIWTWIYRTPSEYEPWRKIKLGCSLCSYRHRFFASVICWILNTGPGLNGC